MVKTILKCAVHAVMFHVFVAFESCVICGVLSCGGVRPTRGMVALINMPHRDNCFILHLLQPPSIETFAAGIATAS